MAKKRNLDYSYGETTSNVVNKINDDDGDDNNSEDLIIGSRKSSLIKTQKKKDEEIERRNRIRAKVKKGKYFGYEEILEKELNEGEEGNEEGFEVFDESKWIKFIGFLTVRIVSPLLLILHALSVGLVLWLVYQFDFSDKGTLSKSNAMPWIMGTLSFNVFLVHYVSKSVFKNTYYKRRPVPL